MAKSRAVSNCELKTESLPVHRLEEVGFVPIPPWTGLTHPHSLLPYHDPTLDPAHRLRLVHACALLHRDRHAHNSVVHDPNTTSACHRRPGQEQGWMVTSKVDRSARFQESGIHDDRYRIRSGRFRTVYPFRQSDRSLSVSLQGSDLQEIVDIHGRLHFTLQDTRQRLLLVDHERRFDVRSCFARLRW